MTKIKQGALSARNSFFKLNGLIVRLIEVKQERGQGLYN